MTPEAFDRWYEASRAAQGLGEHVEDEAVLVNLARLLAGVDQADGAGPAAGTRRRRRNELTQATRQATRSPEAG